MCVFWIHIVVMLAPKNQKNFGYIAYPPSVSAVSRFLALWGLGGSTFASRSAHWEFGVCYSEFQGRWDSAKSAISARRRSNSG